MSKNLVYSNKSLRDLEKIKNKLIKKDYILRLIEEAGRIISRALSKEEFQSTEVAFDIIQTGFKSTLGLDFSFFDAFSPEDSLRLFTSDDLSAKSYIVGDFYNSLTQICERDEMSIDKNYYKDKALFFYNSALNLNELEITEEIQLKSKIEKLNGKN